MKPKIWVATTAYQEANERLAAWADIITSADNLAVDWIKTLQQVKAAVVLSQPVFDASVLAQAPDLKIIARLGAGYDNIDLQAATAAGVCVTYTPGASTQTVAEHTFALILSWLRQISTADRLVRSGHWLERRNLTGPELNQLTLGIVGIGRIGCRVAEIASQGFRMQVLAYDPNITREMVCTRSARPAASLAELLSQADIVSLHVPANANTQNMIRAETLRCMKPTALLVNTSRGSVVNLNDLVQALQNGVIAGAALDVLPDEPPDRDHPLLQLPNMILSPHSGGLSTQAIQRIGRQAAEQVYAVFHDIRPDHLLNPEVWEKRRKG